MIRPLILLIPLMLCWATAEANPGGESDSAPSQECAIGVMVKAIQQALKAPPQASALSTIIGYGTDSRYYVMIRGWLVQELIGVQSQRDATRDGQTRAALEARAEFLTSAIRGIDLE